MPTDALSFPIADPATLSRRSLLQGLLALGGAGLVTGGLPGMLGRALAGPPLGPTDKILVVVTLEGGNDALNTVVPYRSGLYYDARGTVAIRADGVRPIDDRLGLHPNLGWLKSQYDAGNVAVVLGVGHEADDRSHFSSMARWMGGRTGSPPFADGWLGRYLDARQTDALGGIAVGNQGIPLLLRRRFGETVGLPMIGDLFGADRLTPEGELRAVIHAHAALTRLGGDQIGKGPWAQRLAEVQGEAITVSRLVNPAYSPAIPDATNPFVRDMTLAARVINLDVGARVVHTRHFNFDSHDHQRPGHDTLLADVDAGLSRFFATLAPGRHDQVAVLVFSEFGRRIEANGSNGTDHGTAGAAFLIGAPVTGGLYGEQPSLARPDTRGDLRHTVDFRSVYATILESYLQVDPYEILGSSYENLRFFSPPVLCQGQRATLVGGAGADTLTGTARRDVIVGYGGNDRIDGLGGDDLVCAGDGDDVIHGRAGADQLYGGNGADILYGENGADRLVGNAGSDRLWGGSGTDTLVRDPADVIVRQ